MPTRTQPALWPFVERPSTCRQRCWMTSRQLPQSTCGLWVASCIRYAKRRLLCCCPLKESDPGLATTTQMLIGRPPFHAATEYLTFQQILGYPSTYTIDFPATCPAEAVVRRAPLPALRTRHSPHKCPVGWVLLLQPGHDQDLVITQAQRPIWQG